MAPGRVRGASHRHGTDPPEHTTPADAGPDSTTAPPRTASCTAAGTPAATCTPTGSAAWTPATGDTEPLTADTGIPITASDPDLLDTATRYGLTVH